MSDVEIWRPIKGYEERYMVSSFGRIKSIPFTGPGQRNHERLRHFSKSRYGYFHLNLKLRGVSQTLYVHRLVALAFVPNPNGEKTVNHIDGVKTNNRPENLEWASSTENNLHACRVLRKRVKPVVGTCMTTGSVRRYPSIKAAHDDGFNRCCVTKCITGGASSHAGFTWQYAKPTESGASEYCDHEFNLGACIHCPATSPSQRVKR